MYDVVVPNQSIVYYAENTTNKSLYHAIAMHGTNVSMVNDIGVFLQRKGLLGSFTNVGGFRYITMDYNQGRTHNYGIQSSGTYRIRFDTKTSPYQGAYTGKLEYFGF